MIADINNKLAVNCEALAAIGCAVLAVLVAVTVFMRFVLGAPPHWAEELPRLVLVWSAFIGAVVCSHRRAQLTAGILPLLISNVNYRNYVDRFNNLVLLVLFGLLAKAGWDLTELTMGQNTTALQIPAAVLYLSVPVGCAALALIHLGLLMETKEKS